ncbi:hypothetical protein TRFO_31064 [Tritrichomonas foetus]|uniref:Right handed beta helix domain-containing protein n=1 Tax=Tritrichomonas foetus TaxID=1144522 RepID=A0A1J4JS61_9EUKA|nr:hypothetical protein TRFO_31064 [Tritrichomonas foetus]|eukprot:OHT01983.1 hypothetical protein TRFO_31064 [Tritrichomonas foetus]
MNISLNFLQINSISKSPFFIPSITSKNALFTISNSHFQKSTSNVIYSNTQLTQYSILKSLFIQFASRCLTFNSNYSFNYSFHSRTIPINSFSLIEDCKFINIHFNESNGGALYSLMPIIIKDCIFQNCSGNKGGAIHSRNTLQILSTLIINCQATTGACFFVDESKNLSVNFSSLLFSSANVDGSFYIEKTQYSDIQNANISGSFAFTQNGIGELESSKIFFAFVEFSNSSAKDRNSGLSFWGKTNFTIEYCRFEFIQCLEEVQPSAAAIWLDDERISGTIQNCDFDDTGFDFDGFSIYVNCAKHIYITGCVFSYSFARFLNDQNSVSSLNNNDFNSMKFLLNLSQISYGNMKKNVNIKIYPVRVIFVFGVIVCVFMIFIELMWKFSKRFHKK